MSRETANADGETLVRLEDAREQMLAGLAPLPAEEVTLDDALGRVLAEDVWSRVTLPPWHNSAMDGFAVRAGDTLAATVLSPVVLPVRGEVAAGQASDRMLEPGTALRILTGAPLPLGADAVVPVETTDAIPGPAAGAPPTMVRIFTPANVGQHVRLAGSDLAAFTKLLLARDELHPAHLALLAAGGHGKVSVHVRPRVAVLATGDELMPAGEPLGPAQIPDSNSVGLLAQAREAGAETRSLGIAGDRRLEVVDKLREALGWADVVVVSGGVSVGTHDIVKDAFADLGEVVLWRVAVQPGKPLAFARAQRKQPNDDGPAEVQLFGLPGNPVSSFVTFELFVRPVLRRLGGFGNVVDREVVRAKLFEPVHKALGRRAFLRVTLHPPSGPEPQWDALLAGDQSSHVLSTLVIADGLAIIPEQHETLPAGSVVEVIRL